MGEDLESIGWAAVWLAVLSGDVVVAAYSCVLGSALAIERDRYCSCIVRQ